jgi:PTS system mannose-specific IIB component
MVIQIRVDDRLIHGQVVLGWTRELHTPGILVIDDEAATTDKVLNSTLHMSVQAAGGGLKLLIKTNEDAVKLVNDPRMDDYRTFVITRKIVNAWNLVSKCPGRVLAVDCANYGRWDVPKENIVAELPGGFLDADSLEALRNLVNVEGLDVFHQITPNYMKESMKEALKSKGLL